MTEQKKTVKHVVLSRTKFGHNKNEQFDRQKNIYKK